jgi:hypothetical protein
MANKKPKTITLVLTREEWEEFSDRIEKAWEKLDSGDAHIAEEKLVLNLSESGIEDGSHINFEFAQHGEIDV